MNLIDIYLLGMLFTLGYLEAHKDPEEELTWSSAGHTLLSLVTWPYVLGYTRGTTVNIELTEVPKD